MTQGSGIVDHCVSLGNAANPILTACVAYTGAGAVRYSGLVALWNRIETSISATLMFTLLTVGCRLTISSMHVPQKTVLL